MERNEVYDKLNAIFREILDNDEIELQDETTANDIEEWTSLTHIQLIVEIEKVFNLRFTSEEILEWNNVGEMVDSILAR